MGALTRLGAVNQMLLFAGESIVSDLDNASGVDTSIAEFILDQKTMDYQERGLASNQRLERVSPGADGRIKVRTDAISVSMANPPLSEDDGPLNGMPSRIVTRGGYLYNLTDDTDYFDTTETYDLEYVLEIQWEDMDTPIQKAVIMQASREYQMLSQGDPAADRYLAGLEGVYSAKAKGRDATSRGASILDQGDSAVRRILKGRNMYYDPNKFRYPRGFYGG